MFPHIEHATRITVVTTLVSLAAHLCTVRAASLALAWDASADPDVITHAVYYGEVGGSNATRIEVGNGPNVVLNGLEDGKTYFIYAVAVDPGGQESEPSNRIQFTPTFGSNAESENKATQSDILSNPTESTVSTEQGTNTQDEGKATQSDILSSPTESTVSTESPDSSESVIASDSSDTTEPADSTETPDNTEAPALVEAAAPETTSASHDLTQSFPTVVGQQYVLSFTLGANCTTGKTLERSLDFKVTGQNVLLSQPVVLVVPGNGTSWGEQNIFFTADAETTTVTVADNSPAHEGFSLFWDDVRLSL